MRALKTVELRYADREVDCTALFDRGVGVTVEEKLDRIERQITELRESIVYLRGVVERLDKRLNHVETEIGKLRTGLRELRSWFRWIIGILITMWMTIIAAMLLK